MYCTQCGTQVDATARYCSQCGHATPLASRPADMQVKRLTRWMEDRMLAGVCAGFARYFGVDVVLVRLLWLVSVIFFGTGVLLYVIAWIVMPKEYPPVVTGASSAQVY